MNYTLMSEAGCFVAVLGDFAELCMPGAWLLLNWNAGYFCPSIVRVYRRPELHTVSVCG